jgi:hypothetical protein
VRLGTPPCPGCGAREATRRGGRFECSFCGTSFLPRLEPGTLCAEERDGRLCAEPALSLCRSCARPLCDRHNDPKWLYWNASLQWQRLFPRWRPEDAAAWSRLTRRSWGVPVAGFAPFAWIDHEKSSRYRVGQLEEEILEEIRPDVKAARGDLGESACRFESLCDDCEGEVSRRVEETVSGFAASYRRLAYADRLEAVREEALQAIRYIEGFLGRKVSGSTDQGSEDEMPELSTSCPREDWERSGRALAARVAALERFRGRLSA